MGKSVVVSVVESGVGMKMVDSSGIAVVVESADVLTAGNLIEGGVVKRVIVVKMGCVVVVGGSVEVDFGAIVEDNTVEAVGI